MFQPFVFLRASPPTCCPIMVPLRLWSHSALLCVTGLSDSGWLQEESDCHFAHFVNDADRQFIQKRRTGILVEVKMFTCGYLAVS